MRSTRIWLLAALAVALWVRTGGTADHVDGPRASADPAADITDVFAWMSPDAARVNLVMDLVRNAGPDAKFSDAVRYVFHTRSRSAFGQPVRRSVDIECTFDAAQNIQCSGGGVSVAGNASDPAGITSPDGRIRVFAGLRNDPFFFNLAGFRATARAATAAAPSLRFDPAGCPALDRATSSALVKQLRSSDTGGPAGNSFAGFNVIAIVLSIDKTVVTQGGPILSVSGATERR